MRKLATLLLSLLVVTLTFGKSVTMEKASQVANNYFTLQSGKVNLNVANSFSKSYNGITTYYVFNFAGGGFVVVSADDAATPILAQSNEGYVEMEITNPSTRYWFDCYNKEIAHIVASGMDNTESISEWNSILNNEMDASILDVGPLCTTIWDQGQWYNYYCPVAAGGPGGKAWAGCVATTMGQLMKYYNFPPTGVGSHSYTHPVYGLQTANFGATNYNFASMGNSATSSSYQQIATLLYHAGVSVNMNYAPDGSGAYSEDVPWAMSNYFNYDNATIGIAYKADYSTADWKTFLKSELDANRPMYYAGSTTSNEGHAWVCDGYRSSDSKFHMNWGWSGASNGYFAIGALNSGNGNFNLNNTVVYGIQPGNPNLIVRFTDLEQNNSAPYGPVFDINCTVVTGTPTAVNLYIDNLLVFNTTLTTFSYPWNTISAGLGSHVVRVEAIDATDTVYQQVHIGLSEWMQQASGFSSSNILVPYMHAVDSLVVWATAYDAVANSTLSKFTKTTDGGETWTPGQVLSGTTYGLGNICGLNATNAYAAVFSNGASQDNTCGVYKTTNGGSTWTHLTGALQGPLSFADNVWFWNQNEGMCHGDVKDNYFEIYTTTNGGATWTRVPKANIGGGANPLAGEGGWTSVIQAVGDQTIMFGTNKSNLYISHDRGFNWTISNTGIVPEANGGINKICFKDDMNGLVAQTQVTVVLRETHNGGATWQTIDPTGPFFLNDLAYVPGTENTFVSTGSTGASYSFDGGFNWTQFMGTDTEQFFACYFVNNHCGWAGGLNVSATEKGMNKYIGVLEPGAILNPVTNVIAQPFDNSVHLTWTEPVTPPLSYNIYRNDTLLNNTTILQYHDYPVANGQQTYCVTAVYALGESPKSCTIAWITVGVPNTDEAAYRVYPNPANEIINVVAPVKFNEVRLINNLGQTVYRNNSSSTNLHIITGGFDPGMYILQIYTGTQVISKKISINR